MKSRQVCVFGYGSLIWAPEMGVPVISQEIVCIKGWARRFYQGSIDHRGNEENPGRVCTLVPEEGAYCWGMVFMLDPNYIEESLRKLDFREKNGYTVEHLQVYTNEFDTIPLYSDVLTYVAKPNNDSYLGHAPIPLMASHIISCEGLSGKNSCYVLNLAKAVRELMPHVEDDHLFGLEKEILTLMQIK